jgi:hypothetical protein
MSDELARQFQSIRNLYFPAWRNGSNWRICEYEGKGYCDRDAKTIKVGGATENYSLPVLIIHEIAHAVTTGGHSDKWVNRMRKAAERAADLGDKQLADELQSHIAWVMQPGVHDATEEVVYFQIENAAADQPEATFEKVVGWVVQEYGQDMATFLKDYPQARQAYDKADRLR